MDRRRRKNEFIRCSDERGDFLVVFSPKGSFKIDASDEWVLDAASWSVQPHSYHPSLKYVRGQNTLIHRVIMDAPKGLTVDHEDWNGLNNRRYNLRVCTTGQNYSHVRPGSPRTGRVSATGYRGVLATESGKFSAHITVGLKSRYLGTFPTAEAAAHVWDVAALEARGEFAVLNFPQSFLVS